MATSKHSAVHAPGASVEATVQEHKAPGVSCRMPFVDSLSQADGAISAPRWRCGGLGCRWKQGSILLCTLLPWACWAMPPTTRKRG